LCVVVFVVCACQIRLDITPFPVLTSYIYFGFLISLYVSFEVTNNSDIWCKQWCPPFAWPRDPEPCIIFLCILLPTFKLLSYYYSKDIGEMTPSIWSTKTSIPTWKLPSHVVLYSYPTASYPHKHLPKSIITLLVWDRVINCSFKIYQIANIFDSWGINLNKFVYIMFKNEFWCFSYELSKASLSLLWFG
jgi:hypothetical protein